MSLQVVSQERATGEGVAEVAIPQPCRSEACPLYGALLLEDRQRLHARSAALHRPAGTALFEEGDEASHVYLISAGVVQEYKMLPDGRRIITAFHYPGDLLGMTLGADHHCAAEAVTDAVLRRFSRSTLAEFNERRPAFGRGLLSYLSNELSLVQDRLLLLGRKTAIERVASFLIELSERAARLGDPAGHLWMPMGRAAIADHLGLTLETVSRVLSRMRRDGLISSEHRGCLDLLEIDALHELASGI